METEQWRKVTAVIFLANFNAVLWDLILYPLKCVSRYRDPQLQVGKIELLE